MKRKFFDTSVATIAGFSAQMPRVLRYAVENRSLVFSSLELTSLVQPIRTILKTPMAELFDRLIVSNMLPNFASIYIGVKDASIPELLASNSVTIDLKQAPGSETLRSLPELRNKILVNLTSTLRPNTIQGGFTVNAVDTLQNLFCRGALVASYYDSADWLTPYLAEYTAKSYSMTLAGLISRYYNLSLAETLRIAGIFALYYCGLLTEQMSGMPPAYTRCTWVGSRNELTQLYQLVQESGGINNLMDVCRIIVETGPDKMKAFNMGALFAMAGNLGPDLITSQIALEYPPYWVFQIVLALSGAKIPLIYQLNTQKLTAEGRSKFLVSLFSTESLFSVINRTL